LTLILQAQGKQKISNLLAPKVGALFPSAALVGCWWDPGVYPSIFPAAHFKVRQIYGNPCSLYDWISSHNIYTLGKSFDPIFVVAPTEESVLLDLIAQEIHEVLWKKICMYIH